MILLMSMITLIASELPERNSINNEKGQQFKLAFFSSLNILTKRDI